MGARKLAISLGAVVAVALAVVLLLAALLWFVQRGEILPNTVVAGVEVGGLTPPEAADALRGVADARREDAVIFSFEDEEYVIAPEDVGFEVALDETVATAAARGREGLPGDVAERVRSLWTAREYALQERHDDALLAARVDEIAGEVDREPFAGTVEADPDSLEVRVERPRGGASVQRDELTEVLTRAMLDPGPDEVDLPVETTPQPVSDEDVDRVADQVEGAVAAPLTLQAADTSLTLEPATIARLIDVVESGDGEDATLAIEVTPERIEEVLGDAVRRFDVEPENARFVVDRSPPSRFDDAGSTTFTPIEAPATVEGGSDGTRFEPEAAAEQLTTLFAENVREADLEVEVVEPELPAERAEDLRPTHVIGTFTTYYTAGQPRTQNIQRLADVIDDTVVLPGEQFSINEISGERRCDKGYVEAGTIVQGELVDTCGGGVSQFGTTTFNAAFFAGVQLDQWKAHSWYISRYPMGREATLSYPVLDVVFTNTTDAAIVVRASYTSESVTVTLYGQPIADAVRAEHGQPTNRTTPQTQTRTTSELSCGQEREVQGQTEGFTVEVVRTVERTGGDRDQQTIRTVYSPQNRIVERGAC
ncbi:VanW family protein [Egicoccus sp. AB-alg2]|uniref:VanW family protein n=1 Tax=Egicoccus sp. AB-alg2 TaxID=3242693 RepID=UPI00359EE34F